MIDGQCRGSIIRISSYEIHVDDPDFLDVLYVAGSVRRTEKYPWAVKVLGNGISSFVTICAFLLKSVSAEAGRGSRAINCEQTGTPLATTSWIRCYHQFKRDVRVVGRRNNQLIRLESSLRPARSPRFFTPLVPGLVERGPKCSSVEPLRLIGATDVNDAILDGECHQPKSGVSFQAAPNPPAARDENTCSPLAVDRAAVRGYSTLFRLPH
jgi:hypothetical protein